jgi:hypothetical protein
MKIKAIYSRVLSTAASTPPTAPPCSLPSKLKNRLIGYGEAHAPVAPRVVHSMGLTAEVIAGLDIAL